MNYMLIVSRLAAFIVDYIIFSIIYLFFDLLGVWGYLISLLIFFLYRYITTALFGATIGMMLLRVKLVKYDFAICLKREIYRFASSLFYIGYIYGLFDKGLQTFHDNASGTCVVFNNPEKNKKADNVSVNRIVYIISTILLVLSSLRWISYFMLNDIGLIGLHKIYTSSEYFQSFEGDNLLSLSQDELYMKTLGRKYLAIIDIEGKQSLIRISNKLKYTEVYRLNPVGKELIGQFIYRVNMPIQFICSGTFKKGMDLCGISPQNKIILVDGSGSVYAEGQVSLSNILTLRCGDIDKDGIDEAVVLGRGGDVEVFKFHEEKLSKVYSGKIGEDIIPRSFYVDNGIAVVGDGDKKKLLYFYDFNGSKFIFKGKRDFNVREVSSISKIDKGVIVSHVFRNNMTFKKGNIQLLEVYDIKNGMRRIYNFGSRPGRRYSYYVRTLEDVIDINGDGEDEVILKAVGRDDVMGQGYFVEIYQMRGPGLMLNRIFSKIEEILY
ncbi:RDD family protein [Fonticella tunisiensis]|uniref:RDD family protein n=1 Tax=Fonticella tunisiensis TaxID=1096341 RepID=A0A4R7K991_9CLOT|nr:RDD family protein [Fonticella tunisiensis]TDT50559.1 RDD family protein [Fonticella tunisiensis]